jgi:23S rRNA G2069 N7-methylase RlmK/C1962 C5-methylase RlmI
VALHDVHVGAPERPVWPSWCAERILYDEGGLLVVDKPPGIPVYGGRDGLGESVVDRLTEYLGERGKYIGVHSRLDLGTSGALLFTTAEQRNLEVARAMEQGTLVRRYVGLVATEGMRRLPARGTIRVSLDFDGTRARVVKNGKEAITHYKVLDEIADRHLVEFELETGRTHQIRVGMAHLGAPLLGDPLYGGRPAPRLFLHAVELEGGPLPRRFRAPLPLCFDEVLRRGELDPDSLQDVEARVRDALLLRAPHAKTREAIRLIDGTPDLFPELVVDAFSDRALVRSTARASTSQRKAVVTELTRLGFLIAEPLGAELAPGEPPLAELQPGEGSQQSGEALRIREFGVTYLTNPSRLAQGAFPVELSEVRRHLSEVKTEGRVLDLFSGGGSLSFAATKGRAPTVHVDLSRGALEQASRNLGAEGDIEGSHGIHEFWRLDVRAFLARAAKRGERFDVVIADPPAKTTKQKPSFAVPADYESLFEQVFRVLSDQAGLLFVTRHRTWSPKLLRARLEAMAAKSGYLVARSETVGVGSDFRSPNPAVACWLEVKRR